MTNEKELRQRLQRLSGLVRELEEVADPKVRSATKELVQLLMDLHGAAIERMMEKVFEGGETGRQVIDEFGADPLISSLLLLYGLHPDDLETRVARALRRLTPVLQSHGVACEVVSILGGEVRIHASVDAHACGSTAKTARALIEDAIYEVAPDVTALRIEGLDSKPASGFVPLERLLANGGSPHEKASALAEHAAGD
jgi:Fe-S cluster biogenesis protein NfuA